MKPTFEAVVTTQFHPFCRNSNARNKKDSKYDRRRPDFSLNSVFLRGSSVVGRQDLIAQRLRNVVTYISIFGYRIGMFSRLLALFCSIKSPDRISNPKRICLGGS